MKDLESLSSMDSMDSCLSSDASVDIAIARSWSAEKMQITAKRWKLTEREKEQLAELYHRLSDVRHVKNDPQEVRQISIL